MPTTVDPDKDPNPTRELPRLRWLALGAAAGLIAAGAGLLQRAPQDSGVPDGALARVNDTVIGIDRYQRAVDRLASAFDRDVDAKERAAVLQQLLEEELLVQRGIELGMATSETTVRDAIVKSLIASVTAEADAAQPSDAELQQYLTENAERYTFTAALTVDAWVTDDEWFAQDFLKRIRSGAGTDATDDIRRVPGLPAGPLPPERLRMFVGPAIAAAAAEMPVGSSAVYARQGRWYVVRIAGREDSAVADLDAVRSQVLIDYRRSLADRRLREYLDQLMRRADVTIAAPL